MMNDQRLMTLPMNLRENTCLASSQSQRDCVLQPRVARNELPWVGGPVNLNPERVPPKTLKTNEGEGRGEGKQIALIAEGCDFSKRLAGPWFGLRDSFYAWGGIGCISPRASFSW